MCSQWLIYGESSKLCGFVPWQSWACGSSTGRGQLAPFRFEGRGKGVREFGDHHSGDSKSAHNRILEGMALPAAVDGVGH